MRPTKRSDRVLMVLAIMAAAGVGSALWSVRRSGNGGVEWVSNPYRATQPEAPPATPAPDKTAAAPAGVEVVQVLTTPKKVVVGQMTPACKQVVATKGTWKDAVRSEPWPECVDAAGRPMLIQFCSYLKLSTGEWLPASNTRHAPRCQAELALVRRGMIQGTAAAP